MGKKVSISLDAEREIRYNINAMIALEDRFDLSIPQIFQRDKIGFKTIIGMLTIGLKAGGMKFKGTAAEQEERVGEIVQQHWIDQGHKLEKLMDIVGAALKEAGIFDTADDAAEGDAPANPDQDTGD